MKLPLAGIVLLVLTVFLSSAPIPKSLRKLQEPWMPLEEGNTWEFVQDGAGGDGTTVIEKREITKIERQDGAVLATQVSSGFTVQGFRADQDGIAIISTNKTVNKHPRIVLKPELTEGDSWTWDAGGYTEIRTVGKTELLKVPAGDFEAVPIKSEYEQNGSVFQTATVWYSRGIGLVQIDYEGYSHKLKAFTRGK